MAEWNDFGHDHTDYDFNLLPEEIPPVGTPQVSEDRVTWSYISGFYDGPHAGTVIVTSEDGSSETLWANWIAESCSRCKFYRRFSLCRLTKESMAKHLEMRADFEKYVGTHWTKVDERGRMIKGKVRHPDMHRYFYEKWPIDEREHLEGEIVGWFDEV